MASLLLWLWAWVAPMAQAAPPPHLVLISMDTTRADALSCYGQPAEIQRVLPAVTPRLDAVARDGIRFEQAWAHAPTTLNSHATLLTGLDPHQHRVPRNGYPLPADVPTLAERLAGAGYDTIGVVGASALEAEMGLGRGFRVWDDRLSQKVAVQFEDRAEGVVNRTLGHLAAADPARPTFLFVHVFDPHGPIDPPPAWRERFTDPAYDGPLRTRDAFRGPLLGPLRAGTASAPDLDYAASRYLGEVGYTDHHLGRLLNALAAQGWLERAVVVVTADHGEVLSEDPRHAWSHGYDVSEGATRVPLLIRGHGVALGRGRVVGRQVGLAAIAPTLERLAGLDRTLGTVPDLWPMIRPGPVWDSEGWPDRPAWVVLQEATRNRGREPEGVWNNLSLPRSIRTPTATLVRTPARRRDPEAFTGPEGLRGLLTTWLGLWDHSAPPRREVHLSDATRQGLRALGYLGGEGDTPDTDEP